MNKKVTLGKEGRTELQEGVNTVANAVKVTLGAKGRNVIIEDLYGNPYITKDGVTVARSIVLENKTKNLGASLVKEAASKTVDMSGDGTTTCTVLVQSIINDGLEAIDNGADPMSMKKGIDKAVNCVVEFLKEKSNPVDDPETLKNIASISANNDSEIGGFISDAFGKVGSEGLITIEHSNTQETTLTTVDGMKINRGFLSPYFVNVPAKMEVEFMSVDLLLTDRKISNIRELLPILEKQVKSNNPLLIIADDVDGEALATLIMNKMNNKIHVCAVKAPEYGISRDMVMEDLAVLTGGTYISQSSGLKLENIQLHHLGHAQRTVVNKDYSMIINGEGLPELVQKRCEDLKELISVTENEHELSFLKNRLAKMNNGVAVIKVGGVTETEIKEKKDRFDDALCATRSATEEGFVAGGGSLYLHAINALDGLELTNTETIGVSLIRKALMAPFIQILTNGGIETEALMKEVIGRGYGFGYNVKTEVVENLLESGLIDPTKVVRVALENAASIASVFLTTECVIVPKKIKS